MNLKSLGKLAASTALVFACSSISAVDRDARVAELENQMQQVRTETAMGTYGAQTATARAEVDGYGWFIGLDVLYWKSKVGGTDFAYSDQDPAAALPISGSNKSVNFDWDWGVRAALGFNFKHDGWDLKAAYTYFNNDSSDSSSAGINSSLVPLRGASSIVSPNTFGFCTSAKSNFDLTFQSVELNLGRAYYISSKISFHPFWGLKAAWIDMDQNTRYTGGNANDTVLGLGLDTVQVKDTSDFTGLGPNAGIDTRWYLGEGFSIFGNMAGALVFGYFDVDHSEKFTADIDNRIRLSASRHAFSPTVQFQLGLRWDGYFNNNRQHFGIGLGYEGQYWWRANQMLKIDDDAVLKFERYSEDLSMYGVTLTLRLDF